MISDEKPVFPTELMQLLGLTTNASLWRLVKNKKIPPPDVMLSQTARYWHRSTLVNLGLTEAAPADIRHDTTSDVAVKRKLPSKIRSLSLREWWNLVGTENVTKVADELGTSIKYMRLLSYRFKRPGYDRAQKIIELARRFTPGFVPDIGRLMEPIERHKPDPTYTTTIKPSARFLKASAALAGRAAQVAVPAPGGAEPHGPETLR